MEKTVSVTQGGQATIPKELREKFDIEAPGKVKMEEGEDGVVVKPVPHPREFTGILKGKTDEQGKTALEILEHGREADERFLDE